MKKQKAKVKFKLSRIINRKTIIVGLVILVILGVFAFVGNIFFSADSTTTSSSQLSSMSWFNNPLTQKISSPSTIFNFGGQKSSTQKKVVDNYCGVANVNLNLISVSRDMTVSVPKMMPAAVASFNNFANAYKKSFGKKFVVLSMYRTADGQKAVAQATSDFARTSGTSFHEAGLAFDAELKGYDPKSYQKLRSLAAKYGFKSVGTKLGASEDQHFNYTPGLNKFGTSTKGRAKAITASKSTSCTK